MQGKTKEMKKTNRWTHNMDETQIYGTSKYSTRE